MCTFPDHWPCHSKGVAALFIVVVLGAAALITALGASFLGISELNAGFTHAKGQEVLSLADGCLEELLERLRYNPSLTLTDIEANVPSYVSGSCTIEASSAGSNILAVITAQQDEYHKQIIATINPAAPGAQLVDILESSN